MRNLSRLFPRMTDVSPEDAAWLFSSEQEITGLQGATPPGLGWLGTALGFLPQR